MYRRICSLLLSLCLVLIVLPAPTAQAAKTAFSDVSDDAYYADAVAWAVNQGITNGTTATTFSPGNTCTTAQIITFLWRAFGEPEPSIENPFNDVSPNQYFYKAALWARQNGIAETSAFQPNSLCSRISAVYYMWMLNGQPVVGSHTFTDVPRNRDNAVAWAVHYGITSGTSETAFSPDNTCTRAHIVTFLHRANEKGQLGQGNIEIDGVKLSDARIIQNNLYYYIESGDYAELEQNNFVEIVKTIYAELVSIFDYDPLRELNKPLLIKVSLEDLSRGCASKGNGYSIWVGITRNNNFSARTVTQIGHELTHFFLSDNQPRDYRNEEIIAEGMELYLLNRLKGRVPGSNEAYEKFQDNYLNTLRPRDDASMQYYLNPEPISLEEYEEIKNKRVETQRSEIRWVYELLLQTSDTQIRQLRNLHRYYKVAQPIGYIDYDSWIQECPDQKTAEFIENLSKIQPRLVI